MKLIHRGWQSDNGAVERLPLPVGGDHRPPTLRQMPARPAGPGNVIGMSDRSRKIAKPAAALGVLATMASIWWFALRPRRKHKLDE
jgi:hypothetical protein